MLQALGGVLRKVRGLRVKSFNVSGDTPVVRGEVLRTWIEDSEALIALSVYTDNVGRISAGPGTAVVTMPRQPG